jgi:hypothetical protein
MEADLHAIVSDCHITILSPVIDALFLVLRFGQDSLSPTLISSLSCTRHFAG